MMYQELAHFYDALVKDDEATADWLSLIKRYVTSGHILELACGSGEITIALAKEGYQVDASDLSADMIQVAQEKEHSELVNWSVMDMCHFNVESQYNGILCLCDSFNYVLKEQQVEQLFQDVWDHLQDEGIFIMDMHSLDRLEEFEEEYNEVGHMGDCDVQWTIMSEEDRIYQNFAFYHSDGTMTLEQHIQRVYDPVYIKALLEKQGFDVAIFTDFKQPGICTGEKQFFICRKEVSK
ncbi:class I SAM-dependent DNA methyltransferase [Amedibacillus sp. YH-ame10]